MFESPNTPRRLQTKDSDELTPEDFQEPEMDDEPVREAGVSLAEAHDLRTEPAGRPDGRTNTNAGGFSSPSYPAWRGAAAAATAPAKETTAPLFSTEETADFRTRWDNIQAGFVDEPRRCVEQADDLVEETMKRLTEIFAAEREKLEADWGRGAEASTEDLRQALRRYRSFFGRLLAV